MGVILPQDPTRQNCPHESFSLNQFSIHGPFKMCLGRLHSRQFVSVTMFSRQKFLMFRLREECHQFNPSHSHSCHQNNNPANFHSLHRFRSLILFNLLLMATPRVPWLVIGSSRETFQTSHFLVIYLTWPINSCLFHLKTLEKFHRQTMIIVRQSPHEQAHHLSPQSLHHPVPTTLSPSFLEDSLLLDSHLCFLPHEIMDLLTDYHQG